ncbi:MAG TPA: kelch repeat-containing protein [Acidimicrobiales bacterium]|nr:kelch repeat-containing protein [Acidimicrobiales bacterium]
MGVRRAALLVAAVLLGLGACSDGGDPTVGPATTAVGGAASTVPASGPPAEMPLPRTEVAGAVLAGRIVVVGGLTADGGASDRVDFYDPAANRWEQGPSLPLGLHHSGMAAADDRVYVAGGYTNRPGQDWVAQSRVLSLGAGDRAWREEPALSAPRGGLALAAAGGRLVAIGGTDAGGTFLRRTEFLILGQPVWRSGPDMAQARDHLAAASSGGRVYAIAGRLGSLATNMASVESWDPVAGGPWRAEPGLNDTRGGTSAAEAAGRPCVAGGEEPTGTIASVECLADGRWDRVATLSVPRHGLAVAGVGDRLHVIGGGPEPGLFVSGAHEAFPIGG